MHKKEEIGKLTKDCSTSLSGNDSRVSKEIFPDFEPFGSIFGLDLFTVGHPVAVPSPESSY